MNRTIVLALGAVLLLAGLVVTFMEWSSGAQPWGQLLGDNFVFARTLPFTIGLGIALGYWKASGAPLGTERRASDSAIRRFSTSTVWLHALAGVSVVALIGTGGWQYLKGLLAAETPIYMGTVYRIHYFAASLLIFATVAFITDWWLRGEQGLTPGKGQSIRTLRGLAHELPKPLGTLLAYGLGLDLRRPAPPTEQFTFYERLISFPLWELSIGLVMLTGIIKAVRYIYPIPGDVLYWVSAVHVGAGVLLSMKVLDHLRYVFAPSRWPLMATMASGWVPEGFVKRFHPGWYARIESESPSPAVAASSQTQVAAS
jgi:cytochrome b subunit of formate dehydrogenase